MILSIYVFFISIVYAGKTKPKSFFSNSYGYKKYESLGLCFLISIIYAEGLKPKVYFWNII